MAKNYVMTVNDQLAVAKQNIQELKLLVSERGKASRKGRQAATDAVVGGLQAEIGTCLTYLRTEQICPSSVEYTRTVENVLKLGTVVTQMTDARVKEKTAELGVLAPMLQIAEVGGMQYLGNWAITGPMAGFIQKGYRK